VPGGVAVVCTRGRTSRARCEACKAREHTLLCDAQIWGAKAGKTCDRKLCAACAVKVGDLDLCPTHGRQQNLPCQTVPDR
jgi:hypothetical protein